ncbi:MAG: cupin domain-containing protein [Halobacteriales archaeon]
MDHATTDDRNPVEAVEGVHLTQLAVGDRMSVQHVRIESGAVVPEHDHPHEQVGFVYGGELVFVLADGTERVVGPGGSYRFAGGEPHAAENRGDETVRAIDVFSPPRADPDWQE